MTDLQKRTFTEWLKDIWKKYFGKNKVPAELRHIEKLFGKALTEAGENAKTKSDTANELDDESDVQSSISEKKIDQNMTDSERYEALKNRSLNNIPAVKEVSPRVLEKIPEISSWDDINKYLGNNKRSLIRKIAEEFGAFDKEYFNEDIKLSFEFTRNNFAKSYNKKKRNYIEFAKMFSVFDAVVENAVGVEVHNRKNYKLDPTLDNIFVLMSAYQDGEFVVPVKLEVKKFKDKQNTLYVAITLEKIKKTEVWEQGNTENGVTQDSRSVNISIAKIFSKINPSEKNFLKYIPDGFLNREQMVAKQEALIEDVDNAYLNAVKRGDMETAQKMVDEAAKANGYTKLFYHGAKKGGGFTKFRDWSYFTENKAYAERYADRNTPSSLYTVYGKLENAFDTRKPNDKKLFESIKNEYGLSNIQDSGLPDWTDGYDISDYIDDNNLSYD